MKIITSLWQGFRSRPDEWFFYAFIVSATLSVRKILYFVPINGEYNEFTSASLYASDILLFLTLVAWLIVLYNNNVKLSRDRLVLENVPRGTFELFKKICTQLIHRYELVFPLVLVIFSFLSTTWSQDTNLALFRSLKLLEFYLLYLYVYFKWIHSFGNVPPRRKCSTWNNSRGTRGTLYGKGDVKNENINCSTWNMVLNIVIFLGLFQAIVGISQILAQKYIGLFWLKESIISPEMPGVAKVVIGGETWLRAYGLLPHPNVLGGFLIVSAIATIFYFKLFSARINVPRGTFEKEDEVENEKYENINCSTWNNLHETISRFSKNVPPACPACLPSRQAGRRGTIQETTDEQLPKQDIPANTMFHVEHCIKNWKLGWLILAIQILAIILTFSKSAILGLIIAIIFIYYKFYTSREKCSTWNNLSYKNQTRGVADDRVSDKMFHVEQLNDQDKDFYESDVTGAKEIVPPQHKCSTWNIMRGTRGTIKSLIEKTHLIKARRLLLLLFIFIAIIALIKPNYYSLIGRSISDRLIFLNVSRGTFIENPLLGLGAGQYVISLLGLNEVLTWQYQPVHNVFLLILNELGIFILLGFIVFLYKLFFVDKKSSARRKCSTWNNLHETISRFSKNVPRGTIQETTDEQRPKHNISTNTMFHVEHWLKNGKLGWLILAIQILAIILTFSKSAILGLIIAIIYVYYKLYTSREKCSTWNNLSQKNQSKGIADDRVSDKMFHVEQLNEQKEKSFGVGMVCGKKNVPPQHKCSTPKKLFHVEHFTGQAWNIMRGARGTFWIDQLVIYTKGVTLAFMFIMLFDHYLWDIQQGQIMLWTILAILAGSTKGDKVTIDK